MNPDFGAAAAPCLGRPHRMPVRPASPEASGQAMSDILHAGTNASESLNARFPKAARRPRTLPDKQSALEMLYVLIRAPIKHRANVTGGTPAGRRH